MADDVERRTLSEGAARQLANATKTHAPWGGITPRCSRTISTADQRVPC